MTLLKGNCLDTLKTLPDRSVDSIVTDPPYELGFMGKSWDNSGIAYNVELWAECLRVLKPGGHLLSFGGSRTYHRMACAIEDAGFEIRDQIMYLYGSGFPKSLNVTKAAKDKVCQCNIEWPYGTAEPQTEREVRPLHEHNVSQTFDAEGESGEVLLTSLQEQGSPITRRKEPSSTEVWGGQSSVEGRGDTQKGEGQLPRSPLRQVSKGVSGNGSQGWVHNGTPPSDGSMDGSLTESERSSESHQSQSLGQSQGESGTVPDQRRSQEGGSWQVCGRCSKPIVNGWGTALKPAHEPVVVARKPLIGTVANNVLTYGTGALNIDGSRVEGVPPSVPQPKFSVANGVYGFGSGEGRNGEMSQTSGRWPANVIHDGSDEVLAGFPITGPSKSGKRNPNGKKQTNAFGDYGGQPDVISGHDNNGGSAARFFKSTPIDEADTQSFIYCAKASKSERNAGLEESNTHPTVKPLALMRYLVKLVTPPGGTVLDPFLGSGTTACAAILEGFEWTGCEMTEDYWPIIEARTEWAHGEFDKIVAQPELTNGSVSPAQTDTLDQQCLF